MLFFIRTAVLLALLGTIVPAAVQAADQTTALLAPQETSASLLAAVKARRTMRAFNPKQQVTLQELSNLLFAMQGTTAEKKRTVPSSMGAYPIDLYVVTSGVQGVKNGLYRLDAEKFQLNLIKAGDLSTPLQAASMGQAPVKNAQVKVIITAVWERLANQGDNYQRWGYVEAGAIAQNGMVMAAALGLHSVPVGGFVPAQVAKVIGVDGVKTAPVYLNCYGR